MTTGGSEPPISCLDILERLGITKVQAQKRIEIYRRVGINGTAYGRRYVPKDVEIIMAGSRGEGTAVSSVNTDADILLVQRSVKCFETFPSTYEKNRYLVSFLLDFKNVKYGYAMLRLLSDDTCSGMGKTFVEDITNGIMLHNGHKYLRNDRALINVSKPIEGIGKQTSVFDDKIGPAKRIVFENTLYNAISFDLVQAFPVSYPAILDQWRKRVRKYTWPSSELIETVLSRDVLVVSVGVAGSVEEILQWRLSVTLAEQALVQSFNDTQIKLFAAVKIIVKNELKPISDCISSYVVKNVMFWVVEETEECLFRRESFDELMLNILKRLKRCIYWKYLQNYMLPSINILDNKLFETERRRLVQKVDDIIANGCLSALLHCPLVNDMIHMPRKLFQDKLEFRQLSEQMIVAILSIPAAHFKKLLEDNVLHGKFLTTDIEQIICVVFRHVLPIIRKTNPFSFFDNLITMSDGEILYRLYNGARSFAT